jgi:hypothetical protein
MQVIKWKGTKKMKTLFLHEKSFFHAALFNHHQLSLQMWIKCDSEY